MVVGGGSGTVRSKLTRRGLGRVPRGRVYGAAFMFIRPRNIGRDFELNATGEARHRSKGSVIGSLSTGLSVLLMLFFSETGFHYGTSTEVFASSTWIVSLLLVLYQRSCVAIAVNSAITTTSPSAAGCSGRRGTPPFLAHDDEAPHRWGRCRDERHCLGSPAGVSVCHPTVGAVLSWLSPPVVVETRWRRLLRTRGRTETGRSEPLVFWLQRRDDDRFLHGHLGRIPTLDGHAVIARHCEVRGDWSA